MSSKPKSLNDAEEARRSGTSSAATTHAQSGDVTIAMPGAKKDHKEPHSTHSEYLESAVMGMADGLTVPFALTAGLSS